MKMYIHSSFGVLDCQPLTLQAIENSIPEAEQKATEQDIEVVSGSEAVDEIIDDDEDN